MVIVTTPISQTANDPWAWNQLATGFEPWPFVMLANEILEHVVETPDSLNIKSGGKASSSATRSANGYSSYATRGYVSSRY